MKQALLLALLCLTLLHAAEPSAVTPPPEQNVTVPTEAQRQEALNAELTAVKEQIQMLSTPWKQTVRAFADQYLYQQSVNSLGERISRLSNDENASAFKKEIKELKARATEEKRKLDKITPEAVRPVAYYLNPLNSGLSVRDRMYEAYESDAKALQTYLQLLQREQKLLRSSLSITPDQPETRTRLNRVNKQIDVIVRVLDRLQAISDTRLSKVNEKRKALAEIDNDLEQNNIWQKSYASYVTYLQVNKDLESSLNRINELEGKTTMTEGEKEELINLQEKQKILNDQIALLQKHGTSPFADLLKPEEIEDVPAITNPLDIFTGFSFNKKIRKNLSDYLQRGVELKKYLRLLLKKRETLQNLANISIAEDYLRAIKDIDHEIDRYQAAYSTLEDTAEVYAKHVDEVELKVNQAIEEQIVKLIRIGAIIVFLLLFFFAMKQIAKRYISDNERFYMANKVITFANVTLILMVLLFNYIENVNYVVTVFGFASAGIAIAMRDWFMSMLGWLVIIFGGSIHVGDRVRVDKEGMRYVGDVLDISLLRITILEDITLTTYTHNRRAGRIIFIPNNYVFTQMIANYTHVSLKTVWDGIDITITFDSNHKKAVHLAKEITRKYAKGYTDITRKQLNKLRSRYNLKNTNVEPRIFSFAEENGIRVSAWYLTNAYATLTLRSTISMEILDAFKQEDDIQIAYPTQMLHLQRAEKRQPPFETEPTEIV